MVDIRRQATSCTIGSTTYNEVAYFSYRAVGSGSGGALVSPRTVANTPAPVGATKHHVWTEVIMAIDADENALWTANYMTPGTAVTPLSVVESYANSTKTRTITFSNSTCYLQSMAPIKVEEQAEKQIVELTFLVLGLPTVSAPSA